jgi:hypothetical protein
VRAGGEQPFRGGAHRLHLPGELLPERGQHVLAMLADEDLVAEVPSQPRQGGARRGLSHAQPLRGTRDAAFPHELPQRDQ